MAKITSQLNWTRLLQGAGYIHMNIYPKCEVIIDY